MSVGWIVEEEPKGRRWGMSVASEGVSVQLRATLKA